MGHGLLTIEDSRSHSDTPQSVGLFWTNDRPTQRHLPDNTQHTRQASMPPTGFELTIPVSKRPQTHALDRAATGIGSNRKTAHKSVCTFIAYDTKQQ